jgi:hypothetical protein
MRKMGVLGHALVAMLVAAGAGPTGQASALEPGVHVDPGSPAAKQYALPLTQARTTGSGATSAPKHMAGTTHARATHSEPALFGAGIAPGHSASTSARTHASRSGVERRGGSRERRRAGAHSRHGPAMTTRRAASPASSAQAAAPAGYANASAHAPGGSDTLLALLGGGVAVLLVGALGGVILRQSHRGHASGG